MEKRKTILLFIDWYLPGYKAGGPIQSCANLVAHLQHQYNFCIVTRNTDYCETTPYPAIKSDTWTIINEHVQIYYISANELNRKKIASLISETPHDKVYINGVFSIYFSIVPLYYLRKEPKGRVIVAARGMLAKGALAIKSSKKKLFLSLSKKLKLFKHVTFHATNTNEKHDIEWTFGTTHSILIAGNLPKKTEQLEFEPIVKEPNQLKLISIARIAPEKNLKYALEILQQVKANVQFDIYGPIYDTAYYEVCKELIAKMPSHVSVTFKGVVENSQVPALLKKYHALFMPTLGENFGHVILESLTAGRPVIISDKTPWRQLTADLAGFDIELKDTHKFVTTIEQMAQYSNIKFQEYSIGAYQRAETFINDKDLLQQNSTLFAN